MRAYVKRLLREKIYAHNFPPKRKTAPVHATLCVENYSKETKKNYERRREPRKESKGEWYRRSVPYNLNAALNKSLLKDLR
jgi:hypothetical protein